MNLQLERRVLDVQGVGRGGSGHELRAQGPVGGTGARQCSELGGAVEIAEFGRGVVVLPLPGRPTVRYCGAFAPNAKLRPLVVKAGALAPRRRDRPQAAGHDCRVALTDAELAHHAGEQAWRDSGRLPWSQAIK